MSNLMMVIDKKRCIGCNSCTMACKIENNLPKNMFYTKVYANVVPRAGEVEPKLDDPIGSRADLSDFVNKPGSRQMELGYYTKGCQHCDNPPCVTACPFAATYKRDKDGIVVIDYDKCTNCGLCVPACPYNSRITVGTDAEYYTSEGDERYVVASQDTPVGGQGIPPHNNTAEKCTFCIHRIDNGAQPACVESCPARARFFGRKDDALSDGYQLIHGNREVEQIFETDATAHATEPSVYFVK